MATDIASHVAALAAGYKSVTVDRGATYDPASRYETTLEKHLVGYPGVSGGLWRAYGYGTSQANAEANAVANLNQNRQKRYGAGSANTGKSIHGATLTDDLH